MWQKFLVPLGFVPELSQHLFAVAQAAKNPKKIGAFMVE
jgi:hypothetical protein